MQIPPKLQWGWSAHAPLAILRYHIQLHPLHKTTPPRMTTTGHDCEWGQLQDYKPIFKGTVFYTSMADISSAGSPETLRLDGATSIWFVEVNPHAIRHHQRKEWACSWHCGITNSSQRYLLVLISLLGKAVDSGAHSSAKSTHVPHNQSLCADIHIANPPELLQPQVSFSTKAHLIASLQLQSQQTPLPCVRDHMGCMASRTHH